MKVIGHRGDSGRAPENTILAFKKAIEVGADGIELDVHLSIDKYLIVRHDEFLNTDQGIKKIKDMTLKEIKEVDVGKGERVPTLDEVLNVICQRDFLLNVEVKYGYSKYPGIEETLIDKLRLFNMTSKTIISSFNFDSLRKIKKIAPEFSIGLLYDKNIEDIYIVAQNMHARSIHPHYREVNEELAAECKKAKIEIYPWTVNEKEEMNRLIDIGVDGIITNFPGLLIDVLKDKKR